MLMGNQQYISVLTATDLTFIKGSMFIRIDFYYLDGEVHSKFVKCRDVESITRDVEALNPSAAKIHIIVMPYKTWHSQVMN